MSKRLIDIGLSETAEKSKKVYKHAYTREERNSKREYEKLKIAFEK